MTQRYYVNAAGAYLGSYDGPDESMPSMFSSAIEVFSLPEDYRQVYDFVNNVWLPLTPQPYHLPLSDFWLRMTDDEADEFDTVMNTALPTRLRRAFRVSNTITSMTELFTFVETVLNGLFTTSRVSALLAEPDLMSRGEAEEE